jgi:hypothetical protein
VTRGRPAVGPEIKVRLPADTLADLDYVAERASMTRASVVRYIVDGWMARWRNDEIVLPPRGMPDSRSQTNPPDNHSRAL